MMLWKHRLHKECNVISYWDGKASFIFLDRQTGKKECLTKQDRLTELRSIKFIKNKK